MQAVIISEPGDADVLRLDEVDEPAPQRGEVRVRVKSTAVNRADVIQRLGRYPAPPGVHPDIPGLEFAGIVEAAAPDVTDLAIGERVYGLVPGASYAESVVVHHRTLARIPASLSFEEAAAIPEACTTAYDALVCQAGMMSGERVLVNAAASGVGVAAIQIVKALGARVIGTTRSENKRKRLLEQGCDEVIVSADGNIADAVMAATGGAGVDVVLELVGGDYLNEDLRCLSYRGRVILVGLLAGARVELDLGLVLRKRLIIRGTTLRARPLEEKILAGQVLERNITPLVESGQIRPVIDKVFKLSEASAAHRYMESNESFGKIILRVSD